MVLDHGVKSYLPVTVVVGGLAAILGFMAGRWTSGEGGSRGGGPEGGSETVAATNIRDQGKGGSGSREALGSQSGDASPEARVRALARELKFSLLLTGGDDRRLEAYCDAYTVIRELDGEEVRSVLAEMDTLDANVGLRAELQVMLIQQWAKKDGKAAVEFAQQLSQSYPRAKALRAGLVVWTREDPDAAFAWYEKHGGEVLDGSIVKAHLEAGLISSLAQQDMDGAFRRIEKMDAENRARLMSNMALEVVESPRQRTEFIERLEAFGDEKTRDQVLRRLVVQWAWQDPGGAATFLDGRDSTENLLDAVSMAWVHYDPEASIEWRLKSTEGADKGGVVAKTFGGWLVLDRESAENWLAQQPKEVRSDKLYKTAASRLHQTEDFREALSYAMRIGDQPMRIDELSTIYAGWEHRHKEQAKQWLAGQDEPVIKALSHSGIMVFDSNDLERK
jgi:hypothetical protein